MPVVVLRGFTGRTAESKSRGLKRSCPQVISRIARVKDSFSQKRLKATRGDQHESHADPLPSHLRADSVQRLPLLLNMPVLLNMPASKGADSTSSRAYVGLVWGLQQSKIKC